MGFWDIFKPAGSWILSFFRSDRLRQIEAILPYALPVVEAVSKMDWDGDGATATRSEAIKSIAKGTWALGGLAEKFPYLAEFTKPDGTPDIDRVQAMVTPYLKMTYAIVKVVRALPDDRRSAASWGLVQTAIQLAQERTKK